MWEQALERIQGRYGHYSWVHTINNAAAVSAGLLWGDGDYTATVGLTVQAGWDTDSNGATAGSVAGVLLGAAALPGHFIKMHIAGLDIGGDVFRLHPRRGGQAFSLLDRHCGSSGEYKCSRTRSTSRTGYRFARN